MKDFYYTVSNSAKGHYSDRGSKFYSFIFPVENTEKIKGILHELRVKHHSAHHHVYAYALGPDLEDYRAYDDGEPSNSSGIPVLGQIRSNDISNVLIVVIRYFGGTKLGIPGLINAYKTAAANAIMNAEIIKKTIDSVYRIEFDYPDIGFVQKVIKDLHIKVIKKEFSEKCSMLLSLPCSEAEIAENMLKQNHRLIIRQIRD